jgi:small GTP-binding protein
MGELYEHLFKVILIGDWGVGKSNIILRITQDAFDPDSRTTIGVEFSQKVLEFNKKKTIVQIWDTAGQDRYKAITSAYYRAAVGAILVYDISKRSSFDSLSTWVNEIRSNTPETLVVTLMGNKIDLKAERAVPYEEGLSFATRNNFMFFEVSALSGEGIQESFLKMVETVYKSLAHPFLESKRSTSKLSFVDENENEGYFQKIKKGICC